MTVDERTIQMGMMKVADSLGFGFGVGHEAGVGSVADCSSSGLWLSPRKVECSTWMGRPPFSKNFSEDADIVDG